MKVGWQSVGHMPTWRAGAGRRGGNPCVATLGHPAGGTCSAGSTSGIGQAAGQCSRRGSTHHGHEPALGVGRGGGERQQARIGLGVLNCALRHCWLLAVGSGDAPGHTVAMPRLADRRVSRRRERSGTQRKRCQGAMAAQGARLGRLCAAKKCNAARCSLEWAFDADNSSSRIVQ